MPRIVGMTAVAVLTASAALLASPSLADDDALVSPLTVAQCAASHFCLWSAAPYTGTPSSVTSTTVQATGLTTARSVWNRSSKAAVVYSGTSGTGTVTCYAPGAQIASTSVAARSFRLLSSTTC